MSTCRALVHVSISCSQVHGVRHRCSQVQQVHGVRQHCGRNILLAPCDRRPSNHHCTCPSRHSCGSPMIVGAHDGWRSCMQNAGQKNSHHRWHSCTARRGLRRRGFERLCEGAQYQRTTVSNDRRQRAAVLLPSRMAKLSYPTRYAANTGVRAATVFQCSVLRQCSCDSVLHPDFDVCIGNWNYRC